MKNGKNIIMKKENIIYTKKNIMEKIINGR